MLKAITPLYSGRDEGDIHFFIRMQPLHVIRNESRALWVVYPIYNKEALWRRQQMFMGNASLCMHYTNEGWHFEQLYFVTPYSLQRMVHFGCLGKPYERDTKHPRPHQCLVNPRPVHLRVFAKEFFLQPPLLVC